MFAAQEERNAVDDRRMRSELRRIQKARDDTTAEENDEAIALRLQAELNGSDRMRSRGSNRGDDKTGGVV